MTSLRNDDGSATVEFIGLAVILLIPAVYLLISIAQLQAAGYAAVAAADQAAKTVGFSATPEAAEARAIETVHLTAESFHLNPSSTQTVIYCSSTDCTSPGTQVTVHVSIDVGLPLVPSFFGTPTRIASMTSTGYHFIGDFE